MPVKKEETVSIPAINIQQAIIKVVGDSALIMHKWSEKAKKEILDKQMKKAKTKAMMQRTLSGILSTASTGWTETRRKRPRRALQGRSRAARGSDSRRPPLRQLRCLPDIGLVLQKTKFQ